MTAADPLGRPVPGEGVGARTGVDGLPAVVWEADAADLRMLYVSPRARDVLGHDPRAWLTTPGFWKDHVHPDDVKGARQAVADVLATVAAVYVRYRFRAGDGSYRWIGDSIQVIAGDGGARRLVGVMFDITGENGELGALAEGRSQRVTGLRPDAVLSAPLHKTIVDNMSDGVYYVDTERRITYWNRGAQRLTGYRAAEVVGRLCNENFLVHVDTEGRPLCKLGCPLLATLQDGEPREALVWLRHANGSRRPVQVRVAPIQAEGSSAVVGAVETFTDATGLLQAQEAAESARHDSLTDPLTGLANRRLLDAVLVSRKEDLDLQGLPFGVLILDIDHFKGFNDTYGHDVGDMALKVVADTLTGALRGGDTLVRWGGEEFAVVAAQVDEAALGVIAERILRLIRVTHVPVNGVAVPVLLSIGGAMAAAAEPLDRLFQRADQALLQAKSAGRDRYVLDTPSVAPRPSRRLVVRR
jgi:diguanylate cyclase (GGDEF)-like protein/PAS domain S-box-containing protein